MTTDEGKNWQSSAVIDNYNETCSGIFYTQCILYLLNHGWYDTEDSLNGMPIVKERFKLWKSYDLGKTFDTVLYDEMYLPTQYSKIYFTDKDHGMLLGLDSIIKRTNDGGATWYEQSLDNMGKIWEIEFIDDTLVLAGGNEDTLYYSTDRGETWNTEVTNFKSIKGQSFSFPTNIKKLDDGYFYVLWGPRVLRGKWVEPAPVKVDDNETVEDNTKPWFYITTKPNPAFNSMRVKLYGLNTVNGRDYKVKIFNINGEEVKDITNLAISGSSGYTSEFSVNTNDMQKGVHFLRIISGSYSKTHKFVKE